MIEFFLAAGVVLLLVVIALQLVAIFRGGGKRLEQMEHRLDSLDKSQERAERTIRDELGRGRQEAAEGGRLLREEVATSLKAVGDSSLRAVGELGGQQKGQLETLRGVVDERLKQLQEDNSRKLELMRQVVEEKLQGTLERRLGESFRQVKIGRAHV